MDEAVVSIAAGRSQIPLIRAAKRLGWRVIAVDRDPDAPGFELADARVVASTHDAGAVLAALEEPRRRLRIRAVLTKSSGPPVPTTARVARALDLPGLDPGRAELSISKPGFARLCAEAGVSTPAQRVLGEGAGTESLAARLPLVLKPARSCVGKEGVVLVRAPAELEPALERARAASTDGTVCAMEYVEGTDAALAMLFHDGELLPMALLDEHVRFDPDGGARGLGVSVPSRFAGTPVEAEIVSLARRFVRRLGTGAGFLALRVPGKGPPLAIEAHLDLAGDFVADELLGAGAGIDLIGAAIELHAGAGLPRSVPAYPAAVPDPRSTIPSPHPPGETDAGRGRLRVAGLRFLAGEELGAHPVGVAEEIGALSGVVRVDASGPHVGTGGGGRVGYVLLAADDRAGLAACREAIERIVAGEGAVR